jgi:UDP-N-acetyl-D-mannosaminuronic acid dehydrogenase
MTASITDLKLLIDARSATVGVVGLGYVGIPAACLLADSGFHVIGVDIKPDRVDAVRAGRSPIAGKEPGLQELLKRVVSEGRLTVTTQHQELREADVVLLSVETPVGHDHLPGFEALRSACEQIGEVLKDGSLLIVESTIAPGTMTGVIQPALERASGKLAGRDFFLGHCPERVMPGKLLHNMTTMSRVCGGQTAGVANAMTALYSAYVRGDLDPVDCLTAELVKTAENAYRDVGIAFANQLAMICEITGGDVWRVRELVNKVPGRDVLLPGAGVGGHCIPKDSWLLAAPLGTAAEGSLLGAARAINDGMPAHVADMVCELAGAGENVRIAVLGFAYLADSDDSRNSPTEVLVSRLRNLGSQVAVHDPFVDRFKGDVANVLRGSDCAVLMVAHSTYGELDLQWMARLMRQPRMVDARCLFGARRLADAGFQSRVIGVGLAGTKHN